MYTRVGTRINICVLSRGHVVTKSFIRKILREKKRIANDRRRTGRADVKQHGGHDDVTVVITRYRRTRNGFLRGVRMTDCARTRYDDDDSSFEHAFL